MQKILTVVLLCLSAASSYAVEITNFFGTVAARERYEEIVNWYSDPRTGNFGNPYQSIFDNRVRAGYKLGLRINFYDNLNAGFTVRSGIHSVMWKDINDISGLQPGVLEAYIDWRLFQEEMPVGGKPWIFNSGMQFGIIPQEGNAMWDVYAAHNQTDNPGRADDPRDGTFNDRMGALNGAQLTVGIGPVTLRETYHTDKVEGTRTNWPQSSNTDFNVPDKYIFLTGAEIRGADFLTLPDAIKDCHLTVGFDYGFPYRVGNWYKNSKDSVYFDEKLWGIEADLGPKWANLNFGYGYNWRDSVFVSRFWDYKLTLGVPQGTLPPSLEDITFVVRYQFHSQEHQFGQYNGHNVSRDALHLYFNKKILNLDWQPRVILFTDKVDDTKVHTEARYEITTTVTFDLLKKKPD